MILARRIRRLLVPLRLQNKALSLVLYSASRSFFTSLLYSLSVSMWSALENIPTPPITVRISSTLPDGERRTDSDLDGGGGGILQCRPHTDTKGIKT